MIEESMREEGLKCNVKGVNDTPLLQNKLIFANTLSCFCFRKTFIIILFTKHFLTKKNLHNFSKQT